MAIIPDKQVKALFAHMTGDLPGYKAAPPLFTEAELDAVLGRLFPEQKGGRGSGHFGHRGRPGQRGGSLPAGAYLALNKYTRRQARIDVQALQQRQAETGWEWGAAMDEDGENVLKYPMFGKRYVTSQLPREISAPQWDGLKDGAVHVLMHTHPSAMSFSSGDIRFMLFHGIEHMLVISEDGSLHRLSRTPQTIPPAAYMFDFGEGLSREFIKARDAAAWQYGRQFGPVGRDTPEALQKAKYTTEMGVTAIALEYGLAFQVEYPPGPGVPGDD